MPGFEEGKDYGSKRSSSGSSGRGSRDRGPRRDSRDRPRRDSGDGRDSRGPRRDFGDRGGRRELSMPKTVCDECGEKCEVPFRPTEGKPIYCSDCFKKKDNGGSGKDSSKEFEKINEKLDKIMSVLSID